MALPLKAREARRDPFEEVIGKLYGSSGQDIAEVVSPFPAEQRARLALFCYSRAHMREIGLAVAATCDLHPLVETGAAAGRALFELSRERPQTIMKPLYGRNNITLARFTGNPQPFEDADPDLVSEAETAVEPQVSAQPEAEYAA